MNLFFLLSLERLVILEVVRLFISGAVGIFFSHIMRALILHWDLLKLSTFKLFSSFLVLSFCIALFAGLLETSLRAEMDVFFSGETKKGHMANFYRTTFNGFLTFFIWNLLYYSLHIIEFTKTHEVDTLKLKHSVKELELSTLKSQINPHFIFNALNSIRCLIDENPMRAREAVTMLSNIFRSSLQSGIAATISLSKELETCYDYLALEQIRFEERLKIKYNIEPSTLELGVPPMMVQTLIENGIKHGIAKRKKPGLIALSTKVSNQLLEISVQNSGTLNIEKDKQGFGLTGTSHRLQLLYGDSARFTIRNLSTDIVEAKLEIPVQGVMP